MTADATSVLEKRFRDSHDSVLLHTIDGKKLTYGGFWANAKRVADDWRSQGVRPGDKIAFHMENSPGFLCCYLACAIGGFVACPVTRDLSSENIDYILKLIKPAKIIEAAPEPIFELTPAPASEMTLEISDITMFVIIFTSGTTGRPKGIVHRFEAIIGSASSFGKLSGMDDQTRLYHVLPMTYMAGFLNTFMAPLLAGGSVILGNAFSPISALNFWQRPDDENVNTLIITPSIAAAVCRLTRDQDAGRRAVSNMRCIQSTAGQLNSAIRSQFLEIFGHPLQDCYGLTELGGPLTTQGPDDARYEESVGRVLPELDCVFRQTSSDEDELWIRSPFLMMGYLQEDGIEPAELSDGFMATGDLGLFQGDKLYITGRGKDMIVRGGVNIAPIMIENVIGKLDSVEDVAVVGIQHDFWGERIIACILAKEGMDFKELTKEIRRHCAEHLPVNHRPDRSVIMDSFPRALNGKVKKNELREQITDNDLE